MSKSRRVGLCVLLTATVFSSLSYAATPDRIAGAVNGAQTVMLRGNVHRQARPEFDQGVVDPTFKLTYMTLLTTPTASQIKAIKELLAEQQDRNSPNYHQWLTPEQWADRFGLSGGDVAKITAWLKSQGFTIVSVARGRNWIVFSGTAAQAQNAFGTEIHRYSVNGEMHFANATELRIPNSLSGIVSGVRGLNDFRPKPHTVKTVRAALHPGSDYYDNLFAPPTPPDFVAPGDIATMYDIHALFTAGFDGTGQKLAIPGQTDVYLADLNDFRQGFGITQISGCTTNSGGAITSCTSGSNFQYILNGTDPGVSLGDLTEADLDLEWSNAVARNATIVYVNSGTAGGVWDSWYYAVDHSVAPVISLSYGICEFGDNNVINPSTLLPAADELELMKANGLGITVMNSTGDSGAAGCDAGQNSSSGNLATGGLAVGYPASSPEVTGVGGTAVEYPTGFSTTYWTTTNAADGGSAQNAPIPETSWNDDEELALVYGSTALGWQQNYAIVSTGGGASNCATQTTDFASCAAGFPQPSWQAVSVPGQTSVRFSPDVSALGSPNFPGYIFCTAKDAWIGGSSSASTCASGIPGALSLTDSGGNPAPSLVGGTSASSPVFAGIVVLLNQYLGASGLGNVNPELYTLAANTTNGAFHQVTTGDNNVYCVPGTSAPLLPTSLQCPSSGVFGFSASDADSLTGYNLVTGLGSVDADKLAIAWKADVTQPGFTLSPSTQALTALGGNNTNSTTITITPVNSFSGAVTFTCPRGLPTGTTCNFTPVNSTSSTLSISTTAGMTAVTGASVVVTGTSGSVSNSTVVDLTVTAPPQDFTLGSAPTTATVVAGHSSTSPITVTISPINGYNQATTLSCTAPPTGAACTFSPNPVTPDGTNPITSTLTIATNASMTTGALPAFNITAANSGASISHTSSFTLTVNTTDQSFTLAPGASTYSVTQGASVNNASVTLTGTNGFTTANSPLTYTCTDPASESQCTVASTSSTGATFNITTRAPSFAKAQPLGRGSRILYAAFLPGLLGILFTAGTRKRSLRGMRVLGLIVALGFSTMWMASCGGSSSSTTHDPGTPKGSYTITVNATTGGTNALSGSTTFTLQVN